MDITEAPVVIKLIENTQVHTIIEIDTGEEEDVDRGENITDGSMVEDAIIQGTRREERDTDIGGIDIENNRYTNT